MKKIIAFIISFVLFFSMFPLSVFASEDTPSEYDELIEQACKVFPEYASAIRDEIISYNARNRSIETEEIVYQETRSISDTESLGIALTSSGNAIVLRNIYDYFDLTVPSSSESDITTVGVYGKTTVQVASDGYYFKLPNVKYIIYYTGSDHFSHYGDTPSNNFYSYTLYEQTRTKIRYQIKLSSSAISFINLSLYFSNDQLIVELN